jgi:hypothetical protein
MQVQLKQAELNAAVRQYVAAEGLSLVGKDVSIEFTAGRGENGITATVSIENGVTLPVLPDENDSAKPALTVVASNPSQVITGGEEASAETASNEAKPASSLFS